MYLCVGKKVKMVDVFGVGVYYEIEVVFVVFFFKI